MERDQMNGRKPKEHQASIACKDHQPQVSGSLPHRSNSSQRINGSPWSTETWVSLGRCHEKGLFGVDLKNKNCISASFFLLGGKEGGGVGLSDFETHPGSWHDRHI